MTLDPLIIYGQPLAKRRTGPIYDMISISLSFISLLLSIPTLELMTQAPKRGEERDLVLSPCYVNES